MQRVLAPLEACAAELPQQPRQRRPRAQASPVAEINALVFATTCMQTLHISLACKYTPSAARSLLTACTTSLSRPGSSKTESLGHAGTRSSFTVGLGGAGSRGSVLGMLPGGGQLPTLEARVSKIAAACTACAARFRDLEAALAQ